MGLRVAFAPDGSAWACSSMAELRLFEGDELVANAGVAGEVLGELCFSADGTRVLAAPLAFDRAARAWEPRPPETLDIAFTLVAGAWAADGRALALYGEYRPPRRGDDDYDGPPAQLVLRDGDTVQVIWEGAPLEPRSAILVGDEIVAAGGRAIDVRDRATTRPLAVLEAFGVIARTLRLAGGRLAAGAADGSVAVWDASTWEPLGQWTAHPGEARGLDWHGDTLATGGEDGAVRLWSPSGELRDEADAGLPVTGLAFSHDGARLLVARAGPSGSVLELRP
jgi:hypothetical protein